jgi:hypothetical protein
MTTDELKDEFVKRFAAWFNTQNLYAQALAELREQKWRALGHARWTEQQRLAMVAPFEKRADEAYDADQEALRCFCQLATQITLLASSCNIASEARAALVPADNWALLATVNRERLNECAREHLEQCFYSESRAVARAYGYVDPPSEDEDDAHAELAKEAT